MKKIHTIYTISLLLAIATFNICALEKSISNGATNLNYYIYLLKILYENSSLFKPENHSNEEIEQLLKDYSNNEEIRQKYPFTNSGKFKFEVQHPVNFH